MAVWAEGLDGARAKTLLNALTFMKALHQYIMKYL